MNSFVLSARIGVKQQKLFDHLTTFADDRDKSNLLKWFIAGVDVKNKLNWDQQKFTTHQKLLKQCNQKFTTHQKLLKQCNKNFFQQSKIYFNTSTLQHFNTPKKFERSKTFEQRPKFWIKLNKLFDYFWFIARNATIFLRQTKIN